MTVGHIKQFSEDYGLAVKTVMETGFDGVETHGGNGYLTEPFLGSNINRRQYANSGSPDKRCRFLSELMGEDARAIGEQSLAIRRSPFGLFNQARGGSVWRLGLISAEVRTRTSRLCRGAESSSRPINMIGLRIARLQG
jgi:2,4-dienoyl-CoA reductase-like NADH-dependent reductase (Old Yellow Enzyme family)